MIENITYARGRVVELEEAIAEDSIAIDRIKSDLRKSITNDRDTKRARELLDRLDPHLVNLEKNTREMEAIKQQWGLK